MILQNITAGYKPESVLAYFEKLCSIPHGSGNEQAVAEYVESFARERGLFCIRDAKNNVFIRKEATPACKDKEPILLQGHMDMVCAKVSTSDHDFERDGLDLYVENGWLRARGTTLGGDDGIAVAVMLALLDGELEEHPTLECLFTVEEETGLGGAEEFDYSVVTAKRMINLDSESESEVCAGCAGGVRSKVYFAPTTKNVSGDVITLGIDGLFGGHSGVEINCGRANAIVLIAEALKRIAQEQSISLISLEGGEKDNAIPRSCTAKFVAENGAEALDIIEKFGSEIRAGLCEADSGMDLYIDLFSDAEDVCVIEQTDAVIDVLSSIPTGVLAMSADLEGLVEFSRNLGVIEINSQGGYITYSSRSAKEEQVLFSMAQVDDKASVLGAQVKHTGKYPGWDFLPDSKLRDSYISSYREIIGGDVKTVVIHAGLECGIIKSRIPDIDIISVGPDMRNIHTPDEALSLASCERLFAVLKKVITD